MIRYLERLKQLCLAIAGILLLGSCNLDELPDFNNTYLPKYTGGIALLLVNDTITVGEFLRNNITDSSNYSITGDQQIVFSYEVNSDFSLAKDFVEIQSFKNSKYLASPISTFLVVPRDTVLRITRDLTFDFPASKDEELDSLYYSGGSFNLEFNSGFPGRVEYSFSTSSFINTDNSEGILISSDVEPISSPPAIETNTIDLSGYKTNLVTDSDSNKFQVNVDALIYLTAGDVLSGNEYVNVELEIADPNFEVIFGNFGQDTFNIQEKRVKLDFFADLGGTGIVFESPRIDFNVSNQFGIPVAIDFSNVYATYEDADPLYFEGSFPNTPQQIGTPEYGQDSVQSTLTVDNTNSNLRDLFAGSPTNLVMALDGYSNFETTQSNYLKTGSDINFSAKISMPLSLQLSGFEQETEADLEGIDALDGTKELSLVITTENELPFDGVVDLYMLDENGVKVDSLVGSAIFTSPTNYDGNGKVSEPSLNKTEIVMDEELISSLTSSASLLTVVKLDSYGHADNNFVEVFADYKLLLKVGVAGDVEIDLNSDNN